MAHLGKLSSFPQPRMHNSDSKTNSSATNPNFDGAMESISHNADLKSASILITAVHTLSRNMKKVIITIRSRSIG